MDENQKEEEFLNKSSLKDEPPSRGSCTKQANIIAFRGGSKSGNGIEPHTKEAIWRALKHGFDFHVDLSATKDFRCVVLSPDDLGEVVPQRCTFRSLIKARPQTISLERFMRGVNSSLHLCPRIPRIYFNVGLGVSVEDVIITAANSSFPFSFSSPHRFVLEKAREVAKDERIALNMGFWSQGNGSNPLRVAQSIGAQYVVLPDKGIEHDGALKSMVLRARACKVETIICGVGSAGRARQLAAAGVGNVIADNLLMVMAAGR